MADNIRELAVLLDLDTGKVQIGTTAENAQKADPWTDLSTLLEGVAILIKVCQQQGITSHNGMKLDKYINSYIKKACKATVRAMELHQ